MILLAIADIHGDTSGLEAISADISSADVLVLTGDITNFGKEKEALQVIRAVQSKAAKLLAVSGNCDYPEVEAFITKEGLSLHGTSQVINGIGFIGLSGSLITPFHTPNEFEESDFESLLEQAVSGLPPDIPLILVSHQPPLQTNCDKLASGQHVGSKSIRRFIEQKQPLVCLTGHIHEASSTDKIGNTSIINPGPFFKGRYAYGKVSRAADEITIREWSR